MSAGLLHLKGALPEGNCEALGPISLIKFKSVYTSAIYPHDITNTQLKCTGFMHIVGPKGSLLSFPNTGIAVGN